MIIGFRLILELDFEKKIEVENSRNVVCRYSYNAIVKTDFYQQMYNK